MDLGNLPINKTISKRVPVINDGRAALELRFDLTKRLPGYEPREGKAEACPEKADPDDSKLDLTRASVIEIQSANIDDSTVQTTEPDLSDVLEIVPAGPVVLRPAKIVYLIVKYKPTRRMRPFVAHVAYQAAFTIQPLFALRGSCIGREFRPSKHHLPFEFAAQGCLDETNSLNLLE